jgi:molybdate transport system substrate-binding protein
VKRVAVLAVALLLPLAAAQAASTPRLTIDGAASLTEVFPRIDRTQRYEFAGSDQLALQIAQGQPADVFAAASPKYPDQLYAQGLVEKPVVFATNTVVLIVPKRNPAGIKSVYDVAKPGVKLVVGDPTVPIGSYTQKALAALKLNVKPVSQETDVKNVVAKVALGEADAGFVYSSDVKPVQGKVLVFRLPAVASPTAVYEVAIVKSTKSHAAAAAFVRRVLSKRGQALLRAAGFGPIPPS